jgi:hypothetical protein
MPDSTFLLTLVNDAEFYHTSVTLDCVARARELYNAYHAEDGLTVTEQLQCIIDAIEYIDTSWDKLSQ